MKLLKVLSIVNLLAAILLPACNSAGQAIAGTNIPATGDTATSQPELTEPFSTTATSAAEVTATFATPTIIETGALKTYHSNQAGYSAEYPADWTVSEQAGEDGSSVTTFSPADGSAGIMVMVQNGEFGGGSSDIPNTRCEQVKVGGLSGTRCFDTINLATSTTVVANGQTFTIATLGKRMDESLYSRFLSGFQIIK